MFINEYPEEINLTFINKIYEEKINAKDILKWNVILIVLHKRQSLTYLI